MVQFFYPTPLKYATGLIKTSRLKRLWLVFKVPRYRPYRKHGQDGGMDRPEICLAFAGQDQWLVDHLGLGNLAVRI